MCFQAILIEAIKISKANLGKDLNFVWRRQQFIIIGSFIVFINMTYDMDPVIG